MEQNEVFHFSIWKIENHTCMVPNLKNLEMEHLITSSEV